MKDQSINDLSDEQISEMLAYLSDQIGKDAKVIDARQVINARTLPKVAMPNRNGFLPRFPELMPR